MCHCLINIIAMFKSLLKLIVLLTLLLGNMALFTWCVNHLEWDNNHIEKTIISNVRAESATQPQVLMMSSMVRDKGAVPKPFLNRSSSLPTTLPTTQQQPFSHSNSQFIIRFKGGNLDVAEAERARLAAMLQQLEIGSSHAVEVLAADAVVSENKKMPSSQVAKLRAQNVARIIYPHTQAVKMLYSPNLEEDTVVVKFSPSRVK
jgi:hypothetical protein